MAKTKIKPMMKSAEGTETSVLNVAFVWDMSGSMGAVWGSALEGAREYISNLQKDENAGNIRMSITAFDTVFERWFEDVSLDEIPGDWTDRYRPRGNTALNDAVADTIAQMDERHLVGERVLVVVLTDGMENSSQEYSGPEGTRRLAELIKDKEKTGRWTFVYLGAGSPEDVANTAERYNIPRGNTMSYAGGTAQGQAQSFASVTRGTVASASPGAASSTDTWFTDAGLKSVDEQESEEDQSR